MCVHVCRCLNTDVTILADTLCVHVCLCMCLKRTLDIDLHVNLRPYVWLARTVYINRIYTPYIRMWVLANPSNDSLYVTSYFACLCPLHLAV